MGMNSDYNKQKKKDMLYKLECLKEQLPNYTYGYLGSKAVNNPSTAIAYAYDLISFFQYLKEFCPAAKEYAMNQIPGEILDNLSFEDINEYIEYLSADNVTIIGAVPRENHKRSLAKKMTALRGFYTYQCEHGYFKHDATAGANKPRYKKDDHVIIRLTNTEVSTLVNTVEKGMIGSSRQQTFLKKTTYRDMAIITLLLHTGIRVSECVALDLNDVNFKENSIRVVRKGLKEQFVYFDDEVAGALYDYIHLERNNFVRNETTVALFLSIQKGRLCVRSVQTLVKKFAGEAVPNKTISAHKMRSTYGTELYKQTGDIELVADVLGHSDLAVTKAHYVDSAEANRKKAGTIKVYGEKS